MSFIDTDASDASTLASTARAASMVSTAGCGFWSGVAVRWASRSAGLAVISSRSKQSSNAHTRWRRT